MDIFKIREVLFNCIGIDDRKENNYLADNLTKLLDSNIEFHEDHKKIYIYLRDFFYEYGTVPSLPGLLNKFENDLDVITELNKIFPVKDGKTEKFPLVGENYCNLLKEIKYSQCSKEFTTILKTLNLIDVQGVSEKIRGKEVWKKGTLDAIHEAMPLLVNLEMKLVDTPDKQVSYLDSDYFFNSMLENSSKEYNKMTTGYPTLDSITFGGVEEKAFWVIAAPAGMLKSTICLGLAYNQFISGYKIEFISLEMSSMEMWHKFHALHSSNENYWGEGCLSLETNKISNPQFLDAQERKRYREVLEDIKKQKGYINFHSPYEEMSVSQIYAHLISTELKNKIDLDMVYIDHGELIKHLNPQDGYSIRVAESIRKLRRLSLSYRKKGIRIGLAYQIKREGLDKAEKGLNGEEGIYSMTDLSWTTEAERSATFILTSYYHKTYFEKNEALLSWCKNRHGVKSGKFLVDCELEYSLIQEKLSYEEQIKSFSNNYIINNKTRGTTGRKTVYKHNSRTPDPVEL
jgi:hypothetical protein